MGHKHEIAAVLLLEIPSDQQLLLRLQIVGVADPALVFFRGQLLGPVKPDRRDSGHVGQGYPQQIQLLFVLPAQQLHHILKHSGLHVHDILKAADIAHLEIQAGILV